MSGFESPIGSRKFNVQQMREIDVPDESDYENGYSDYPQENIRTREKHNVVMPAQQELIDFHNKMYHASERNTADVEQEIKAAREAKRTGREKLNEGAKRRIEILIGMTRSTRDINIDGNVFVLQTLKSGEMRDAIFEAAKYDGTVQGPYEARRQFLARSLVQVAGTDLDQFIGSNSLEAKLVFVDELDEYLLNRLYDEYLLLTENSRKKYAIKNDTDAKEVFEDLKK